MDLDAILGELCELETQLTTQQTELNDSLHKVTSTPSTGAKYAIVQKDVKRKNNGGTRVSRTDSVQRDSQRSESSDRSSGAGEGVNPFDAIQSQFQSALSELSGLVGGSMDPIYDPSLYGGLSNGGGSNSQSSETLICDSNSSTLTHSQSKSSATKQKQQQQQQHRVDASSTADRQNANVDPMHQGDMNLPRPPQIPLPPNLHNGNNRTSSGSEGNSSDSGFHQMSSGQSNYSDDSLPPPPPLSGLKMSPSPEPPPLHSAHLQIDCDYDAQQDYAAHEGCYADADSAFSDSMSLPSSGSHISVTTTSSGSSMGSGGITNSPTPVSVSASVSILSAPSSGTVNHAMQASTNVFGPSATRSGQLMELHLRHHCRGGPPPPKPQTPATLRPPHPTLCCHVMV